MLSITNYVRAKSLEEAYELCQKKTNVVLGGMLWLKMQDKNVNTAIDLCDLGLNTIEEADDAYVIGSMVSLRALEVHTGLHTLTRGAMAEAVKHIVGVQFRNVATLGGSLFGRFGFSDVLTIFQVLDAKVELYHHGVMDIADFAKLPRSTRDILVRVIVPKAPGKVVYLSQRNTATDFPTLTCAVSYINDTYTCSIGATPFPAVVFTDDKGILADGINQESAEAFAQEIASRAAFGSNVAGGAAYRKKVCTVLVRRALLALQEV